VTICVIYGREHGRYVVRFADSVPQATAEKLILRFTHDDTELTAKGKSYARTSDGLYIPYDRNMVWRMEDRPCPCYTGRPAEEEARVRQILARSAMHILSPSKR